MRVPAFTPYSDGEFVRTDFMTTEGAQRLMKKIEGRWRAHGYDKVRCRTEPLRNKAGDVIGFAIRSNLVNGLPPK